MASLGVPMPFDSSESHISTLNSYPKSYSLDEKPALGVGVEGLRICSSWLLVIIKPRGRKVTVGLSLPLHLLVMPKEGKCPQMPTHSGFAAWLTVTGLYE